MRIDRIKQEEFKTMMDDFVAQEEKRLGVGSEDFLKRNQEIMELIGETERYQKERRQRMERQFMRAKEVCIDISQIRCYIINNQLTKWLKTVKGVFSLLEVSGLSFHYQPHVPVLTDLTFSVLDGEIAGLLGKNGVGKTTALKLILGLLPIEKGSICLGNYSLDLHPMQYKKQINYAGKKRIDLLGTRQFLLGLFSVCLLCLRQTTILYFCLELVFGL